MQHQKIAAGRSRRESARQHGGGPPRRLQMRALPRSMSRFGKIHPKRTSAGSGDCQGPYYVDRRRKAIAPLAPSPWVVLSRVLRHQQMGKGGGSVRSPGSGIEGGSRTVEVTIYGEAVGQIQLNGRRPTAESTDGASRNLGRAGLESQRD